MSIPYSGGLGLEPEALTRVEPPPVRLASRRHHAWQSAMEQAQLAGWFKPGLDAGPAREPAAVPPVAALRATSDALPMPSADGTGQGTQAPIPRSVSSLAVSQALHASDGVDQAPVDADAAQAQDRQSPPEAATLGASAGSGEQGGPAGEPATLQLAAQVWRQVEASIPAGVHRVLGVAVPAVPGAALRDTVQGEPAVVQGLQAQRTQLAPVAMAALQPAASPVLVEPGAAVRADAAAQWPDEPMALPRSASRVAMALPPGNAPVDEAAAAMRVHVDWSEQGANVWLGVNHERLASLPGLARQLDQWFLASGVKLASLVCNGRTIPTRFSQRRSE